MENLHGSDTALVGAFCDEANDDARQQAFRVLLQRHGAMVLGTCRRVIGNHSDAEDAAQAVFITLAAKARHLRDHPTIGGWLHRSARHIAMRQRDAARTRTRYEGHQEARAMTAPSDNLDDSLRTDMREELDDALDSLAERYRVPLVLHYLDGHSQEDVARILQVKEGTLASLLSRGRELLRQQLQRKGVTVSALLLVTMLTSEAAAQAAVPSSFIIATAKSGSAIAAGSFSTAAAAGTAAPHVLALASGGGSAITTFATIKIAAASFIAASLLSMGAVSAVNSGTEKEHVPALVTTANSVPTVAKTPTSETQITTPPAAAPLLLTAATAEAAMHSAIDALRFKDMAALLRHLDPEGQQRAKAAWDNVGQFVSSPWVGGMFSRMVRVSNDPQSGNLIANYVTPMLMMIDANQMAEPLTKPEANEETFANQNSNDASLAMTEFTDADKAKIDAMSETLKKFGSIQLSEHAKLEVTQFLDRVSLVLPVFKRAFVVNDYQID
jgi:RNA polymerase sigma factor (sigma-70 family)